MCHPYIVYPICIIVEKKIQKVQHVYVPQKEIAGALQNILCYEEKHEDNVLLMDEEWFIRVHLDVTQVVLTLQKLIRL